MQSNWVFVTNSSFLIPISLQHNVVDLRYFKRWILLDEKIQVWNIKGLHHQVEKIYVVCYKDSIPLLQYETEDWRCFNPSFFLILVFQTPQFDLITKTNLCGLLNISWCQTYNLWFKFWIHLFLDSRPTASRLAQIIIKIRPLDICENSTWNNNF